MEMEKKIGLIGTFDTGELSTEFYGAGRFI